ncbi:MAG: TIGR00153 family protein [Deltaproteobacteria bacterium]|nr:TIGR00153 family protein [Deltaproteobacteria bacterium]MBW2019732.1 TIGR00153 family protein [Deltaproteobacteria bacterium]MBW2073933.1 TIGR00153 family protein [Deltaproteobacteria bacterium]RLB81478.1 MAG: TIGR00153 family protein [Deltaproteobacteria bacterium]
MRLLLNSLFYRSPFENLQKHADKVKECAHLFKEAAVCHIGQECKKFDLLTEQVARLESEADGIKRNIRNHLPRGILMPVDKFQFFEYLREQDKVLDEVEDALFWLSFRPKGIPDEVATDFHHLVEAVIPPIEKLSDLVSLATGYFRSRSEAQRTKMKSLIRDIRQYEREADLLERELKFKIFGTIKDALVVYHLIQLVGIVGDIADHAQNASDRMRAMIAK